MVTMFELRFISRHLVRLYASYFREKLLSNGSHEYLGDVDKKSATNVNV